MVAKPKPMSARIKRGDDFILQMTVRNHKSKESLEQYAIYQTAYKAWKDAINTDLPDEVTIADKLAAYIAAFEDYDTVGIVDITGWSIRCAIAWGGQTIVEFDCNILNYITGSFEVIFTTEKTSLLKPREYDLELRFTQANQQVVSSQNILLIVDRNVLEL